MGVKVAGRFRPPSLMSGVSTRRRNSPASEGLPGRGPRAAVARVAANPSRGAREYYERAPTRSSGFHR